MSLNIVTIKAHDFELQPGQKVIRAEDYSVIEKSTALIDQARQQANTIVAEAREAFEQEKQRGYQEGLMQCRMEQSGQMLKMVDQSIRYLSDVEASMADILMTAVKKIIDGYDDRALTVGLVKAGLQHVRNERQVSVRVPPSHYAYVKERIGEILTDYKGVGILNPVSDPRLKAGSCILESKIGVVDASIDIQLKALQQRFGQLTAHGTDELQDEARDWADKLLVDADADIDTVDGEIEPAAVDEALNSANNAAQQPQATDDDESSTSD